ncbi:hypothetical protein PQU95_11825 [Vogesella sp. DC21W]|uniref:Uncharacterized protein n=1 Tax=Vogesella aquatica TaxID=2984206 RepID=A0ABT5IZ96_9NEIS|nr:hypothetical protein [Vogesella aquatica]MDC7717900.1 hypothetical protein [Vogesella aquatica]
MQKIMVIGYYGDENKYVGAIRPKSLSDFLRIHGYQSIFFHNAEGVGGLFARVLWFVRLLIFSLRFKPDTVVISIGPYWYFVLLSIFFKVRSVSVIIDVRDGWSCNISDQGLRRLFRLRLALMMERVAYLLCDHYVVVTPGLKDYYSFIFKTSNKIEIIMNGHSINSVAGSILNKKHLIFAIFGKYAEYGSHAEVTTEKLKKVMEQHASKGLEIWLIGCSSLTVQLLERYGMASFLKIYNRMPYDQAINILKNASVGVCAVRDQKTEFGTKIFDYIGCGLPVFDSFDTESNVHHMFSDYLLSDFSDDSSFFRVSNSIRENAYKYHRNFFYKKFLDIID